MQRHLHVQHGVGVHALKVNVQNQLLEGVHLHVTQQHLAAGAVEFHLQNGRMEGLFFQSVPQCVVVQLNVLGVSGTAIHNTRGTTRNAQTAARTRSLLRALKSDKFHSFLQKESTATSVTPVKKVQPRSSGAERRVVLGSKQIVLIREQTHDRFALGDTVYGFCNQGGYADLSDA